MKVKANTVVLVSILLVALTVLIRREGYGTESGSVQGSADAPEINPVWRAFAIIVAALAVGGIVVYATKQYK